MAIQASRAWIYFLQAYYLSTPAFYLLDRYCGINLRASYFDDKPTLNIAYYIMSFGCGLLCLFFRKITALVGLFESILNILLLILGFGLTYVAMINSAANDAPDLEQHIMNVQSVGNFLISGFVATVSFYMNPLIRREMRIELKDVSEP